MVIREMNWHVANDPDELHCFQACFQMALATLTAEQVSAGEAELLTAFVPGKLSWPLAGMHAFAERGLYVSLIEDFRPAEFVADARREFERQYHSEEGVASALEEIDVSAEQAHARLCLEHPRIDFVERSPSLADVGRTLTLPTSLCIPHCNYRSLVGREGYVGHYVVVREYSDGKVRIDDPGLPAQFDWWIEDAQLARAAKLDKSEGGSLVKVSSEPLAVVD